MRCSETRVLGSCSVLAGAEDVGEVSINVKQVEISHRADRCVAWFIYSNT